MNSSMREKLLEKVLELLSSLPDERTEPKKEDGMVALEIETEGEEMPEMEMEKEGKPKGF